MIFGAIISIVAQATLATSGDFGMALFARLLSGVGQGMLLIGVQAYILENADPTKSTQGAGIIVYGFNGAMISGAAIGSLLSVYLGVSGVFWVATIISTTLFFFILVAIKPAEKVIEEKVETVVEEPKPVTAEKGKNPLHLLVDFEFMRSMLLIGIPTKAVLAGVTIFALPLILNTLGFANDSIGQIIMFYAAGVLLTSHFATKLVDRIGKKITILTWGALLSAVGLCLVGMTGIEIEGIGLSPEQIKLVMIVIGTLILGLSHGLINAPVVTHVLDSESVAKVGKSTSAATYRFLERTGHVMGPIILANVLIWTHNDPKALMYVGIVIGAMAVLFWLPLGRRTQQS